MQLVYRVIKIIEESKYPHYLFINMKERNKFITQVKSKRNFKKTKFK